VPSHLNCAKNQYKNFVCREDNLVLLELFDFHFGQELLQLVVGKSFKKAPLLEVLNRDIFSVFNPSLFLALKEDLLEGFLNMHATKLVVL
jgi:hypothetical protein